MIAVGSIAPEFEAVDAHGRTFRSSSLRGRAVVLYFFPKAFAGVAPGLREQGVQVVGVSVDTAETQAKFAAACGVDFPLLADPTKAIARSYGVLSLLGSSKRATIFIDAEGRVEETLVSLLPGPHLVRTRARYGPPPGTP
jgi:thioredoxin-dependent peroxiredoxin